MEERKKKIEGLEAWDGFEVAQHFAEIIFGRLDKLMEDSIPRIFSEVFLAEATEARLRGSPIVDRSEEDLMNLVERGIRSCFNSGFTRDDEDWDPDLNDFEYLPDWPEYICDEEWCARLLDTKGPVPVNERRQRRRDKQEAKRLVRKAIRRQHEIAQRVGSQLDDLVGSTSSRRPRPKVPGYILRDYAVGPDSVGTIMPKDPNSVVTIMPENEMPWPPFQMIEKEDGPQDMMSGAIGGTSITWERPVSVKEYPILPQSDQAAVDHLKDPDPDMTKARACADLDNARVYYLRRQPAPPSPPDDTLRQRYPSNTLPPRLAPGRTPLPDYRHKLLGSDADAVIGLTDNDADGEPEGHASIIINNPDSSSSNEEGADSEEAANTLVDMVLQALPEPSTDKTFPTGGSPPPSPPTSPSGTKPAPSGKNAADQMEGVELTGVNTVELSMGSDGGPKYVSLHELEINKPDSEQRSPDGLVPCFWCKAMMLESDNFHHVETCSHRIAEASGQPPADQNNQPESQQQNEQQDQQRTKQQGQQQSDPKGISKTTQKVQSDIDLIIRRLERCRDDLQRPGVGANDLHACAGTIGMALFALTQLKLQVQDIVGVATDKGMDKVRVVREIQDGCIGDIDLMSAQLRELEEKWGLQGH
ncbi:hypothetical protein B0T14DRAFT_570242 [Immersiella caudata]|uniref:Uncharacterized protein n=1 Tax=Immersiella caudata TaxID=314043 RepID=A0AA39WF68_9PEZI|nr:hypothetical protein B0T14DRAFT_570242 [Immersiella caudata]